MSATRGNPGDPTPPGHTRARPDYDFGQVAWEQLVAQRAATQQLLDAHERMIDRLEALETPPMVEAIVIAPLSAALPANPVESREKVARPTMSIGIYNPNNIIVYFSGIGSANANARAWSAPPNSLLVVPISAGVIELGCDPVALATLNQNVIVQLLRFYTVQPAFLGQI